MQALYNANKAVMMVNVGMLIQQTSKVALHNGTAAAPRNLYSHSNQTLQWQTSNPIGTEVRLVRSRSPRRSPEIDHIYSNRLDHTKN